MEITVTGPNNLIAFIYKEHLYILFLTFIPYRSFSTYVYVHVTLVKVR